MKEHASFCAATVAAMILCLSFASAQNTAPYWSLSGNSNTTASSKLGTTNGVSLRFYANNVQRMMIGYSTGNVAIGTTSLTHRLTVGGNGRFTTGLQVDNGGMSVTNTAGRALTVTGSTEGIRVINSDVDNGTAIYASGADYGVNSYGQLMGVRGRGDGVGVEGEGLDYESTGVAGTGEGFGVSGFSYYGIGVHGTGDIYGVSGVSRDSTQYGVYGYTKGTSVQGVGKTGVYGYCNSHGYGLQGYSRNGSGIYAYGGLWAGYFAGSVYATGTYQGSDRSLKQNIADVTSAMDLINRLQPKSYTFRQDGNYKSMNLPSGTHYGLIAQEVEQVLPDLVKATEFETSRSMTADGAGTPQPSATIAFKALNYTELIPIALKGLQELSAENRTLKEENKAIRDELATLRQLLLELKNGNTISTRTSAHLDGAYPNPAKSSTRISYQLPAGTSRAQLLVTDDSGKTVKAVSLNGSGALNFDTATLSRGVYQYSLVVNGTVVETKKLTVVH